MDTLTNNNDDLYLWEAEDEPPDMWAVEGELVWYEEEVEVHVRVPSLALQPGYSTDVGDRFNGQLKQQGHWLGIRQIIQQGRPPSFLPNIVHDNQRLERSPENQIYSQIPARWFCDTFKSYWMCIGQQ